MGDDFGRDDAAAAAGVFLVTALEAVATAGRVGRAFGAGVEGAFLATFFTGLFTTADYIIQNAWGSSASRRPVSRWPSR